MYDEIKTYFQDSAALLQENFDVSQPGIDEINKKVVEVNTNLEQHEKQKDELDKIMKEFKK
ncbi:hypothetical protein [Helicobacter trogontum]|uniref:Uncharacterized protein n=1 Tax=Helicobacter trogontum TaxID=50960 RepID=A0A4U8TES7_9HELI|nr:hypothetical protein [Helicobacter trogontum]MCI5787665.1 hypothetical protein [Helicobacter trogontum]MDY5185514.1 hypothetical protein [Helicobacter trogontum]TLD98569.1 hypothetical protein LS80_004520 [Helicobacter trogontum]